MTDGDVPDELSLLAAAVRDACAVAGLPVDIDDHTRSPVRGVRIDIDRYEDEQAGVYVSWYASPELEVAGRDAVAQGRFDDPAIGRSGQIARIMLEAVRSLLEGEGLTCEPADDLRPNQLKVSAAARR